MLKDYVFIYLQEWRHAHGMRCLQIPNTAHFANVTLIEDALACKL
jgi:splicing factor 3A subunit 3